MVIASSLLSRSLSFSFPFSDAVVVPALDDSAGPCGGSDEEEEAASSGGAAARDSVAGVVLSSVCAGAAVIGLSSSSAGLETAETSLRRTSLLRDGIAVCARGLLLCLRKLGARCRYISGLEVGFSGLVWL